MSEDTEVKKKKQSLMLLVVGILVGIAILVGAVMAIVNASVDKAVDKVREEYEQAQAEATAAPTVTLPPVATAKPSDELTPTTTPPEASETPPVASVNPDTLGTSPAPTTTHSHVYKTETVAATCEHTGCTIYTCKTCNDSYKSNETEKLAHDLVFKNTIAPTVDAEGYDLYNCKGCNAEVHKNPTSKLPKVCDINNVVTTANQYAKNQGMNVNTDLSLSNANWGTPTVLTFDAVNDGGGENYLKTLVCNQVAAFLVREESFGKSAADLTIRTAIVADTNAETYTIYILY